MELAIKEAKKAALRDEIPIGAIIKEDSGKVIAKESNKIIELCDPTAHAEINAIRIACTVRKDLYLSDCTMYVTLEPCIMCAGASYWTRIKKIVFGAFDKKRGFLLLNEPIIHPKSEVVGGVLEEECSKLLKDFFGKKRQ